MRLILILFATLLWCIVANAKNASGEKGLRKKCKDESCDYKKIDKYKESDEGTKFRWNRNFKNHKNNIYDVDKKNTESVYKPKFKKAREEEIEPKKYVKKSKKREQDSEEQKKIKNQKFKTKNKDSTSTETSEVNDGSTEQPSTELQCDSSENTCSAQ